MANMDLLLKALDSAIWEMGEAFKGLPDADVWVRPHPALLSVGELAAHVAFWESASFFGESAIESPLARGEASYYTKHVENPLTLSLGSEAVFAEVQRIHDLCKAEMAAHPQDSEGANPHRDDWTWGQVIEYQVFHVAYHTGQMYSVRHLMGHHPVDN